MKKIQYINWKKIIQENLGITIFVFCMGIYYGWRMFTLDPWYDELYTYYSFISRGPVYAAIHWPVPNNHVMYSVVSGFLNIFGNAYISLRGISWLASVGNLILLYCLANRFMNKTLSLGCSMLYGSFYLVNYISIQGRGYTLAIGFYLMALLALYDICVEKKDRIPYYLIFSLALTWGLYTITSNLYWVLPVCFVGGCYLLFQKEFKILWHLIISSVIAALHTLGLYSIIWLAIGSNLLCKTPDSGYYGIYQVKIILQTPWKAWKTGMDYMLASPYVQSIDRSQMLSSFPGWLKNVMNLFVSNGGGILLLFLLISLLVSIVFGKKAYSEKERGKMFLYVYIAVTIITTPLILIVQSVLPYHRVFTFLGVLLSLSFFAFMAELRKGEKVLCGICLLISVFTLFSGYYTAPYADRETEIKNIWQQARIGQCPESICFIDDYQKYVLQFYWDYRPEEATQEEARYLLMPREVMNPEYTQKVWPVMYTYDEVNWEALEECRIVTESEHYVLYERRK